MFINPIAPIGSIDELRAAQRSNVEKNDVTGFGNIFKEAWQTAVDAENKHAESEYLLATGQLEDPHTATISATNAQLSVTLLTQLRNKALDSYNELMRTSL